jgi:hypothetical protein
MGTRADFYVGRGEKAEWLGSIAWDGYPDGITPNVLAATTEDEFRAVVKDFATTREDWTAPEMGWPWPWDTSHTTDYAYAFDGGVVYGSGFGHPWFDAREPEPDGWDEETGTEIVADGPAPVFPDMSARKAVTLGRRSGLIVVEAREDDPA